MFINDGIIFHERRDLSVSYVLIESVLIEFDNSKNRIINDIIYKPPCGSLVTFHNNVNNIPGKITHECKLCFSWAILTLVF